MEFGSLGLEITSKKWDWDLGKNQRSKMPIYTKTQNYLSSLKNTIDFLIPFPHPVSPFP